MVCDDYIVVAAATALAVATTSNDNYMEFLFFQSTTYCTVVSNFTTFYLLPFTKATLHYFHVTTTVTYLGSTG